MLTAERVDTAFRQILNLIRRWTLTVVASLYVTFNLNIHLSVRMCELATLPRALHDDSQTHKCDAPCLLEKGKAE
jgi:hypothetical protein